MQDRIIKHNGKSSNIKFDLTSIASFADFQNANTNGTLKADVIANNDGTGTDQLGMALNKQNLLKDSTATSLGLTSSATPDDALYKLGSDNRIGDIITSVQPTLDSRYLACNGAYIDSTAYPQLCSKLHYFGQKEIGHTKIYTGIVSTSSGTTITRYCNGKYFRIAQYSNTGVYTSTDLENWTLVNTTSLNGYTPFDIAYGNGYYVLDCYLDNNRNYWYYAYSTDLVNWTLKSVSSDYFYNSGIYFVNGYFAMFLSAVANNTQIAYFTPGGAISWENAPYAIYLSSPNTHVDIQNMFYYNGYYCIGYTDGVVAYSTTINGTYTTQRLLSTSVRSSIFWTIIDGKYTVVGNLGYDNTSTTMTISQGGTTPNVAYTTLNTITLSAAAKINGFGKAVLDGQAYYIMALTDGYLYYCSTLTGTFVKMTNVSGFNVSIPENVRSIISMANIGSSYYYFPTKTNGNDYIMKLQGHYILPLITNNSASQQQLYYYIKAKEI